MLRFGLIACGKQEQTAAAPALGSTRGWKLAAAAILLVAFAACAQTETTVRRFDAEIAGALAQRHLREDFQKLAVFFGDRLDASAGTNTFSDKDDTCRIAWVDHLLRHPELALAETEQFSRQLHEAARDEPLEVLIQQAIAKLVSASDGQKARRPREPGRTPPALARSPGLPKALATLESAISAAQTGVAAAFAPLTDAERAELRREIYPQTTLVEGMAHRTADKVKGQRVFALIERADLSGLHRAAFALAPLAGSRHLSSLSRLKPGRYQTRAGTIVVGGPAADEYRLEDPALSNVCAVIDPGGDDVYFEGTVSEARPVLVIIDLSGNDQYRATQPGVQGGAVLGAGLLVDVAGNDRYEAQDVAQGTCLVGTGLLVDIDGDDTYRARSRVQGQAVAGIGVLLDRAGNDRYRAAVLGQGVGGPLGLGLLDDLAGDDEYFAGGLFPDPYDDSAGYSSFSQGVGVGPRGSANGGIGVLLDGGGDDLYEFDGFGHAGAYWFSVGIARDFVGNDQRVGATRTAFDGGERTEPRFVRYGCGYACHYAVSALLDDDGDDAYFADFASIGFGWDVAVALVWDGRGNDRYNSPAHGIACAVNGAFSAVMDGAGDDVYTGADPVKIQQQSEYHPDRPTAKNFAFLIDLAGQDKYPAAFENSKTYERGWAGGFLIDRE